MLGGGGQFSYIEDSKQVPSNHQDSVLDQNNGNQPVREGGFDEKQFASVKVDHPYDARGQS